MDEASDDIDALLMEIQGTGNQQSPLHHPDDSHCSQVMPNASSHRASFRISSPSAANALPQEPARRSILEKQPSQTYDLDQDASLDAFDRALLAEYTEPTQNQPPIRVAGQPHTGKRYRGSEYISESHTKQPEVGRNGLGPFGSYPKRSNFQPAPQTPLGRSIADGSSPVNLAPSSPLAGFSQRRESQTSLIPSHAKSKPRSDSTYSSFQQGRSEARSSTPALSHVPPMIQGIQLVSLNTMPDRFRSVFPFPLFNAVQSKCFQTAYNTSDNLVLSAPTGSGKTAVLEVAICRLAAGFQHDQYKIIYMAPTKSLCAERQRDWQAKFTSLDLLCAELTGDTNQSQLRSVQNARIIITTPEKWDSMTRKWKDHIRLMQLVKLFLIDEVHILKETRGACLEAVVSRMKSVGSDVRFIALSATVPNSEDIATWLGKDPTTDHLPAQREKFGEEFRPVKLQKHVYGLPYNGNDFGFEKVCDPKLPEIISKHSQKKPIMIFCMTRKAAVSTAKLLTNLWVTKNPQKRPWPGPTFQIIAQDPDLKETLTAGVAFHHAGLDLPDRNAIERGFLEGQVSVICSTSTLAVGVNLPCHLVIIKNTVCFTDEGIKEYADLEMMQMLGRAGRPQFDDSATAIIITKQEKVQKYEKMVSGQEVLESCLHLNLLDHLNAEIGLGTIHDLDSAKRWLAGTFFYVRLGLNPSHYKLDGDATDLSLDDRIERICQRDIDLLLGVDLISTISGRLKCTEFGEAMARYYVNFETMKGLLGIEPRSKISDVLSALVGAEEFRDVRYRVGEKKLLKGINSANGIKYPIKVDIALSQHKRSLIIQAELGSVEFPADEQYVKLKRQYQLDKKIIFTHIHRLIRCIIDCQIHLNDAVTVRNALELARSLGAKAWDNTPHQMKQIPSLGPAAVRKLASGGINSIEKLEMAEPHRIEMLMSRNPPFGNRLLASLEDFPRLRVSVKVTGKEPQTKTSAVKIKIKAEVGFMNEKPPVFFHQNAIHICFLAERSDGFLIDFRRISAKRLNHGQDILITTELTNHSQSITCYVMCDDIAGTMRYAELNHGLPPSIFPLHQTLSVTPASQYPRLLDHAAHKYSGAPPKSSSIASNKTLKDDEEILNGGVDDQDMFEAVNAMDFNHIDSFEERCEQQPWPAKAQITDYTQSNQTENDGQWNATRLENGKWACNHKCKDKTICKQFCCHEGVDKPPKPPKKIAASSSLIPQSNAKSGTKSGCTEMKFDISKAIPAKNTSDIETVDLAQGRRPEGYIKRVPQPFQGLKRLHESIGKDATVSGLSNTKPTFSYKKGNLPKFGFLNQAPQAADQDIDSFSEDGTDWMNDLPSPSTLVNNKSDGHDTRNMTGGSDFILSSEGTSSKSQEEAHKTTNTTTSGQEMNAEDSRLPPFLYDGYAEAMEPLDNNIERESEHRKQEKSPRLFLSTDSPERPANLVEKHDTYPISEYWSSPTAGPPDAKRPRVDCGASPEALRASSSNDTQAATSAPTIKPGHPNWVYEMDPAFIAEWEPYVEFV